MATMNSEQTKEMNSEQTTEEGGMELTLENYYDEFFRLNPSVMANQQLMIFCKQTMEKALMELRYRNLSVPLSERLKRLYEMAISYPDADGNIIISQVQPDFVTPRGGSNAVPVEPNYNTVGVGERTYADILQAIRIASIRSTMRASRLPIQFIAAAEASPGFTVSDVVGVELNDIARAYIRAQDAAHFRRSTFGAGSGHINATMSAEASPGGGDGLGVEWNDDMLQALLRSTARAIREHSGSQDLLVDEAGGRFVAIHIHPPQQGDHGSVEAARGTQDGPGDLARRALPSVIGGLVPLCFNLLLDDSVLKAGGSPGYVKAAAYAGLGLVTVFTFVGLASKKRAKAAARVVASTSTAAVSIAVVYQVSDNVYTKCVCGIMGCIATLATMAIDW